MIDGWDMRYRSNKLLSGAVMLRWEDCPFLIWFSTFSHWAVRRRAYLPYLEGIFTFPLVLLVFRFNFSNPIFSTKVTNRKGYNFRKDMIVHGIIASVFWSSCKQWYPASTDRKGNASTGFVFRPETVYNGFVLPRSYGLILLGLFIITFTLHLALSGTFSRL